MGVTIRDVTGVPDPALDAPRGGGAGGAKPAEIKEEPTLFVELDDDPEASRKRKRSHKKKQDGKPAQKAVKDAVGFQAGHHALVSGATKSGKTQYVVDLLLQRGVHKTRKCPWDAVIVMCDDISIRQDKYKELKKKFKGKGGVKFIIGLPVHEQALLMDELESNKNRGWKTLLVVDDLMTAARRGKELQFLDKLFTSARHLDADVWQLTQEHTDSRTRRLNVGYLICFRTPACVKSLAHVCSEIKPETGGKDILAAYRTATEDYDGHGCLVICLNEPHRYMFRNTRMDVCFDLESPPVDEDGTPVLGGSMW